MPMAMARPGENASAAEGMFFGAQQLGLGPGLDLNLDLNLNLNLDLSLNPNPSQDYHQTLERWQAGRRTRIDRSSSAPASPWAAGFGPEAGADGEWGWAVERG